MRRVQPFPPLPRGAQAPLVARLKAREPKSRRRGGQVVAAGLGVRQKLLSDNGTHHVHPHVCFVGAAEPAAGGGVS